MPEEVKEPEQLSLPYEAIEKVSGRDAIRVRFKKRGNRESYFIPWDVPEEREGFNDRIIYEGIEELAEWIFEHQELPEPLKIDVLLDGRVLIDEGYRRMRAVRLLHSQGRGENIMEVECYANNNNVTELERTLRVYSSNNGKPLKPIEQAGNAYKLKHFFGKTHDEIGKLYGVSRQKVDYLIKIAEADDSIKDQIKNGDLTLTAAISLINKQKSLQKEAEGKEEDSHRSSAAPNPEPDDLLKEDIKGLQQLDEEAERIKMENRRAQELERLLEIANEVLADKETLTSFIGKIFAADVYREWKEDFVDEGTGEVVTIQRAEMIFEKGDRLTEEIIPEIILSEVEKVYLYKVTPPADSVLTTGISSSTEKPRYDENRPEIAFCQNVIGGLDKLEAITSKIECIPQQSRDDIAKIVGWVQRDMVEIREYVHKHKDQNKR